MTGVKKWRISFVCGGVKIIYLLADIRMDEQNFHDETGSCEWLFWFRLTWYFCLIYETPLYYGTLHHGSTTVHLDDQPQENRQAVPAKTHYTRALFFHLILIYCWQLNCFRKTKSVHKSMNTSNTFLIYIHICTLRNPAFILVINLDIFCTNIIMRAAN